MRVKKTKKRSGIEEEYKWDLTPVFKNDEEWEKEFKKTKEKLEDLEKFKGKINNAQNLYNAISKRLELWRTVQKLFMYARMKSDEDQKITKYQSMKNKTQLLETEYGSKNSFINPEILILKDTQINSFYKELPKLKEYKRYIEQITRLREHTLSKKEEKILAMSSILATAPENVFDVLENADLKFGTIKKEKEEIELTPSNYITFMKSKDRKIREQAYKKLYSKYLEHKQTLGALRNASVNQQVFYKKTRGYKNSIETALYPVEIDTKVYYNLIKSINKALPLMHKYMKLKKEALNVDELRMWDIYAPLVKEPEKNFGFEQSFETIKKALEPMGQKYVSTVEKMKKERWIDVLPNQNKTSGAYSWGVYDSPSYILLNHENKLKDVFTIIHEIGHSMHKEYSKTQPFAYARYTIFCAEVASTTNEQLLANYLLKEEPEMKAFMLNTLMEEFRTTLFRQAKFAEFEKITHEMVENNEPLNTENLCELYSQLNKKYYGNNITTDEEISIEWARIPHFYNNFYVYTYSTGIISALAISKNILENPEASEHYINNFLKAGNIKPPLEILNSVGVDLTSEKPTENAIKIVENTLNQLKKELK